MTTSDLVLVRNLVRFARVLKSAGAVVAAGTTRDLLMALAHVELARRQDVYYAMRAACVRRREDFPLFDAAFVACFGRPTLPVSPEPTPRAADAEPGGEDGAAAGIAVSSLSELDVATPSEAVAVSATAYSATEQLLEKDFAHFTEDEVAEARALLSTLRWQPEERRTHRWRPSPRGRLDLQRWLRRCHRHGGELLGWPTRARRTAPRPLVVLCDISGSMQRYSRMLMLLAHAMASRRSHVEVFVFATRLARVTRYAHERDTSVLTRALPHVAPDWAGGTRIGDVLRTFNRRYGQRALRRRPVVLLISDGWDRGEPALLRTEIARLGRSCARVIWLNPLLGTPGYTPLTRGLQAALPYVDDFLPAHNLGSLLTLTDMLNRLDDRPQRRARPAGREPGAPRPGEDGPAP